MMSTLTVTPAYGRDYSTADLAIADWHEGKDFCITDIAHPYNGSYCSVRDIKEPPTIRIRYWKNCHSAWVFPKRYGSV